MGDTLFHIIGNRRVLAVVSIIIGVSVLAITAHAFGEQPDPTAQSLAELHSQLEAMQVSKHSLLKIQADQAAALRKTTESIDSVNKNIADLKDRIDRLVTGDTGTGSVSSSASSFQ